MPTTGATGYFTALPEWARAVTDGRSPSPDCGAYECGLPSTRTPGRFTVGFYLVALMLLIFDIEVVLLYPTSVVLRDLGMHALLAIAVFVGLLGVAFVYDWRRGALDWIHGARGEDGR